MADPSPSPSLASGSGLLELLGNPKLQGLAALGAVILNRKLGLGLDSTDIGAMVALVVGNAIRSGATEHASIIAGARATGDAAAAKVVTLEDAAKALGPKP